MGNPTLFYPGDEPTPCWTCAHFKGLHTKDGFAWVNCVQRGRFTPADTEVGCRFWLAKGVPLEDAAGTET